MVNTKKNSHQKQERMLFILMGLIIVGLIVSGYFLFIKKILPELSTVGQNNPTHIIATQSPTLADSSQQIRSTEEYIPQEDAHYLTVYFCRKGKDMLGKEKRKVRKNNMIVAQARQIVETILEGPIDNSFYKTIPEGTTLRGLFFNSGIFIVDLSHEFAGLDKMGASEQTLGVYSIVNSLTELDTRVKVRFLINGSETEGKSGHIDISLPLTRLENIIEKDT